MVNAESPVAAQGTAVPLGNQAVTMFEAAAESVAAMTGAPLTEALGRAAAEVAANAAEENPADETAAATTAPPSR